MPIGSTPDRHFIFGETMETFDEHQRIARLYTIRRSNSVNGQRYSRNRHHFLLQQQIFLQAFEGTFEAVALAERHMMMPQTELVAQVAIVVQKYPETLNDLQAIASFHSGYGGRKEVESNPPIGYPVVLQMRKYHNYGRTSKLFYEGCLGENDLVYDDAPRVHLRGDYDIGGLVTSYVKTYMNQVGFPYITPYTPQYEEYPAGYRIVTNFGGCTAERLTTIPDAQRRKTHRALPFLHQSRAALDTMQIFGDYLWFLSHDFAPRFGIAEKEDLITKGANFYSALGGLALYYGDGLEKDKADCWRPSSGLNPGSLQAQLVLYKAMEKIVELGQALTELPEDDEHMFDAYFLSSYEKDVAVVCGLYMLFLDLERFTGTPEYIPHGESKCYKGAPPT